MKYGLADLALSGGWSGHICTKAHYLSVKAAQQDPELNGNRKWTNDGPKGKNDLLCSESVLLEWLLKEGNYRRYRGNKHGVKKIKVCEEISYYIASHGLPKKTAQEVKSKIQYIEKKFREAHDFFFSTTGQGLRETDSGSFNEMVMKRCPWFFDLQNVMGDSASVGPQATTESLFGINTKNSGEIQHGPTVRMAVASNTPAAATLPTESSNSDSDNSVQVVTPNKNMAGKKRSAKMEEDPFVAVISQFLSSKKKARSLTDEDKTEQNIRLYNQFEKLKEKMPKAKLLKLFPVFKAFLDDGDENNAADDN